ncbi:hypothetical protein BDP27DRAFT_1380757 [Rhodocollybia butyracea]|uniref:Uncharacterized protein n=1 Tax=Rhodocollybia butyracea TaxID=206335 RepID=A0A9P5PZT7_9AGAR|nr:hypothetical protein BDP27DRAFT_1380757 [Rhodocollybia butyracea]
MAGHHILIALSWLNFVRAVYDNTTDPYLGYKPEFARSLPVQTLVTGVVFTLVAVLFIHIIFTGQYHWPLAPLNYALQLSGVVTLLVSLIATMHVVLSAAKDESEHWPYMLSYLAVYLPPLDNLIPSAPEIANSTNSTPIPTAWTTAERGTWMLMNATVSVLVQINHIQFLTLLFPSRLEARLIYFLLGPLALTSAIMQCIPIQESNDTLNGLANNIRNVCNATLSLLFTSSLFIWGLLVNRSQAWRTDGGTAVFGASALGLAVVSTALTFLYVPKNQEYVWLPGLIWAVILWQSFLGWWWWVGAGSGQSAQTTDHVVEILLQRSERLVSRRRESRENKRKKRHGGTDHTGEQASLSEDSSPPPARPRPRRTPSDTLTTSSTSTSSLPSFLPKMVHDWIHNLRHAIAERIREMEMTTRNGARVSGWGLGSFGWRVSRNEYEMEIIRRHRRRNDSGSGSDEEQGLPRKNGQTAESRRAPRADEGTRRRSMWWWGPLDKWRLQDTTVYH